MFLLDKIIKKRTYVDYNELSQYIQGIGEQRKNDLLKDLFFGENAKSIIWGIQSEADDIGVKHFKFSDNDCYRLFGRWISQTQTTLEYMKGHIMEELRLLYNFPKDYCVDNHSRMINDLPLILFKLDYDNINEFEEKFFKPLFNAITSNKIYQESGVDYSVIRDGGYQRFREKYFGSEYLKYEDPYCRVIEKFDEILETILKRNVYTKSFEKDINKKSAFGYAQYQALSIKACEDGAPLNTYINSIMQEIDTDTLQLMFGVDSSKNLSCPLEIYSRNIPKMIDCFRSFKVRHVSFPNIDDNISRLKSAQELFDLISGFVKKSNYSGLLKFIKEKNAEAKANADKNENAESDKEPVPNFSELLKKSISDVQRIRKAIIATKIPSMERFDLELDKENNVKVCENIGGFSAVNGMMLRTIPEDEIKGPIVGEDTSLLEDMFEVVGLNYLNKKSKRSKEDTKKLLTKIAGMIFGFDGILDKDDVEELFGMLNSEDIIELVKYHADRYSSRNPLVNPSYVSRMSPKLREFIEKETENYTKPFCTDTDKTYSDNGWTDFYTRLNELLTREVKPDDMVPVKIIECVQPDEFEKQFPEPYTLSFIVDNNKLNPEDICISGDPFSDDLGNFSNPYGIVKYNPVESKQNEKVMIASANLKYNGLLCISNGRLSNEDNTKLMNYAHSVGLPIYFANRDTISKDLEDIRQKAIESKQSVSDQIALSRRSNLELFESGVQQRVKSFSMKAVPCNNGKEGE